MKDFLINGINWLAEPQAITLDGWVWVVIFSASIIMTLLLTMTIVFFNFLCDAIVNIAWRR